MARGSSGATIIVVGRPHTVRVTVMQMATVKPTSLQTTTTTTIKPTVVPTPTTMEDLKAIWRDWLSWAEVGSKNTPDSLVEGGNGPTAVWRPYLPFFPRWRLGWRLSLQFAFFIYVLSIGNIFFMLILSESPSSTAVLFEFTVQMSYMVAGVFSIPNFQSATSKQVKINICNRLLHFHCRRHLSLPCNCQSLEAPMLQRI